MYRQGLASVPPGIRSRKAAAEARWKDRLPFRVIRMASGNEWPLHKKTGLEDERIRGVGCIQRSKSRAGDLADNKESLLIEMHPGWRIGRTGCRRKVLS